MSYPLDETLSQVAEETFENLAFMLTMPWEDDSPLGDTVVTRVGFSGPFTGCLSVAAGPRLLGPLAGNMMGLDDEPPDAAAEQDALRELANVICGNLLPLIAGTEAVFKVHSPEILPSADRRAAVAGLTLAARVRSCLDEGEAEVELWLDQTAWAELQLAG